MLRCDKPDPRDGTWRCSQCYGEWSAAEMHDWPPGFRWVGDCWEHCHEIAASRGWHRAERRVDSTPPMPTRKAEGVPLVCVTNTFDYVFKQGPIGEHIDKQEAEAASVRAENADKAPPNPREGTWRCAACDRLLTSGPDDWCPEAWTHELPAGSSLHGPYVKQRWLWDRDYGYWTHVHDGGASHPAARIENDYSPLGHGQAVAVPAGHPERRIVCTMAPVKEQGGYLIPAEGPVTFMVPKVPAPYPVADTSSLSKLICELKAENASLREQLATSRKRSEILQTERESYRLQLIDREARLIEREARIAKLEAEVAALRSQDRRAVVRVDNGWDD